MKNNTPMRPLVLAIALATAPAHGALRPVADIADLSLEQLTQVTVTSASRREARLVEAPASIFVITAEDIRRSGATSIAEVLRMAPNLQVLRGDTSQYVISARGGLTPTANKMLVLMDGRTLYTPLFAGVFYDAIAVVLEDVERIEVISGPGSTLWGTNAVNGVINITTRSAHKTQGAMLAAGAGDAERGGSARMGWTAGEGGAVRAHARYFDRDARRLASGASAQDAADRWQVGLRGDWERARQSATFQAGAYEAHVGHLGGARKLEGGHVLGRWTRTLDGGSTLNVHGYYDRTEREHAGSFREKRDTVDVEALHGLAPAGAHRLTWGGGYRASRDDTTPMAPLAFVPEDRTLTYATLFAQDEIALSPRLQATLGVRAERNRYTGVEWLPNARLAYSLSPQQLAWGAVTRTVRSPSRIDRDLVVPGVPPFVIVNNDSFESELANVAEVGYRANLGSRLTVSFTAFQHRFDRLRTLGPANAPGTLMLANAGKGRTEGVEAWGDLRPSPDWRLAWGFTVMDHDFELESGRVNATENPMGNNPKRTAHLRASWNIAPDVELDVLGRYVAALPTPAMPSYAAADVRLGWRPRRDLELSLRVENAGGGGHVEAGTPAQRAVLERTWFLKATWRM